jgi:nucleoside-diphosphate-sugar epimerase
MPRIVVTGGAGYVGSVLTGHLLMSGWSVVVVDALAGGGESLLGFASHPMFRLVAGDVRDSTRLDEACEGAQAVIHLAAVVGEGACAGDADNSRAINLGGTMGVLDAAERRGVERFIFISTCSNYGVSDRDALATEESPLHPLGVYAQSKVDAERAVLDFKGKMSTAVLRLGTICGLSVAMRFDLLVNDMARAAALGDSIQIFAPEAWRPFLHVRDASRAIEHCLGAPAATIAGRVFNVVGENFQKKELVELVHRHYPAASISLEHAIPDARDYRVSGARFAAELGFRSLHTVEAAFLEMAGAVQAGMFRDPRWARHAAAPPTFFAVP